MADTLIAQVGVLVEARAPRTGTNRAGKPRDVWRWYEVRIGKGRRVSCSCHQGALIDSPKQLDQTLPLSACPHITALYSGNITADPQEAKRTRYAYGYGAAQTAKLWTKLTTRGEAMFHYRWAAAALTKD